MGHANDNYYILFLTSMHALGAKCIRPATNCSQFWMSSATHLDCYYCPSLILITLCSTRNLLTVIFQLLYIRFSFPNWLVTSWCFFLSQFVAVIWLKVAFSLRMGTTSVLWITNGCMAPAAMAAASLSKEKSWLLWGRPTIPVALPALCASKSNWRWRDNINASSGKTRKEKTLIKHMW